MLKPQLKTDIQSGDVAIEHPLSYAHVFDPDGRGHSVAFRTGFTRDNRLWLYRDSGVGAMSLERHRCLNRFQFDYRCIVCSQDNCPVRQLIKIAVATADVDGLVKNDVFVSIANPVKRSLIH